MPAIINITDEDITYSESILLKETQKFDDERVDFIKNFDTLDLQAVPGSGKTTVLLAKLLILERYMPLKKNRGVLVLSHTNVAIDEITERIGKHCPKLFSFPNFIGTIQSFVDQFLAIPYYNTIVKKKPYRIDNEIYDEQIEKYSLPYGANNWVNQKRDPLKFLKDLRLDENSLLTSGVNKNAEDFELKNPETPTYKALVKMKKTILTRGYLHFDDAYLLAFKSLNDYPKLKKFFKKGLSMFLLMRCRIWISISMIY
nr:UvrD-helicase domain-containing protein [Maribacter aestuarii]